jgi:hypothetical protein
VEGQTKRVLSPLASCSEARHGRASARASAVQAGSMSLKGTSREQRRRRQRKLKQIRNGGIPMQPTQASLFAKEAALGVDPRTWRLQPASASSLEHDRAVRAQAAHDVIDQANREQPALVPFVRLAVPLWAVKLAEKPLDVVLARAHELADVVAGGSDVLFRSSKRGETARAFNAIAEGLAALSFTPGGVTFLGMRFESVHPESSAASGAKTMISGQKWGQR